MLKMIVLAASAAIAVAGGAVAQSVKSQVAASNGILVTVHSDDFANRYEYTGPDVAPADGYAFVARIDSGGERGRVKVIGAVYYRGDWRFYDRALLRGGEDVAYQEGGRDVVSCRASRYSGCSVAERYTLSLTPEQIEKHAVSGILEVQLRSRSATTEMLRIPVDHFAAVNEVADRRTATAGD